MDWLIGPFGIVIAAVSLALGMLSLLFTALVKEQLFTKSTVIELREQNRTKDATIVKQQEYITKLLEEGIPASAVNAILDALKARGPL